MFSASNTPSREALAPWVLALLRCPETGLDFYCQDGHLLRRDGRIVSSVDGVPCLVWPTDLVGDDAHFNHFYDRLAPWYDWGERVLGRVLTGVDMVRGRADIVARLGWPQGLQTLEVSPGPGVFLPLLRRMLGQEAPLAALDLSQAMLRQCRLRHGDLEVALVQGNAQFLPFADASFEALFHFGGVNLFNQPEKALAEFVRVLRPGGYLAWGDEQMSANFRHPLGRRLLPRLNPGFLRTPPLPPAGLTEVVRHEVYQGLGYLMLARKAA